MARRRRQLTPWRAAGTRAEARDNADDVVRETGWVFNNLTGDELNLANFVQTGDAEVDVYVDRFGWNDTAASMSILEIGSGIGRMTAAFTRRFASVVATDVDAAFLERCRETVARFGRTTNFSTVHIADGQFDPRDLDIEVGGTVMWINDDVASHDLQFIDTPKLYSGVMKPTKSWIHTFDRVGTYEYYCDFHNTLKGTVVVHAAP